jgi:hypothetical protein
LNFETFHLFEVVQPQKEFCRNSNGEAVEFDEEGNPTLLSESWVVAG